MKKFCLPFEKFPISIWNSFCWINRGNWDLDFVLVDGTAWDKIKQTKNQLWSGFPVGMFSFNVSGSFPTDPLSKETICWELTHQSFWKTFQDYIVRIKWGNLIEKRHSNWFQSASLAFHKAPSKSANEFIHNSEHGSF